MLRTRLIIILFTLLTSSFAFADKQPLTDGNSLLEGCELLQRVLNGQNSTTAREVDFVGQTKGFLFGMREGLLLAQKRGARFSFVMPDNITNGQFLRVIAKFLSEHPERLHEAPYILVEEALAGAFPRKP